MSDYWKKKLDELEKSTEEAAPSTSYWQSKLNELEEEEKTKEEKKRKEEEQNSSSGRQKSNVYATVTKTSKSTNDDIAPVVTTSSKDDDRKWFQKGAFEDGITVGNIAKAILGTREDIGTNIAAGILGLGETITDTAAYVSAATALPNTMRAAQGEYYRRKVLGEEPMTTDEMVSKYYALNTNLERAASQFISQDLYNEEEVARKIIAPTAVAQRLLGVDAEADSILGERSDSLVQSGGQLLATTALSAAGVPWWIVSGASAFGGQAEQALNENASFREAGASAAISAAAEVLSEKLSGGIKFGGKTLDDALLKPLTERIASKGWKFLANVAKDAAGEGLEEVFSSAISNLGKKIYKDESIKELLFNEQALDEYLEGFFGGAILGGIGGVKNAQTTDVEQQVITHEYNKRVEAEKAEGKKLTVKDLSKIYNTVDEDVENGRISVDTIEEALGGEDYKNYKSELESEKANKEEYLKLYKMKSGDKSDADIERQAELKKLLGEGTKSTEIKSKVSDNVFKQVTGTRLLESYNERERKSQKYEADVSKYDEGQRKVIQSAIDSGILNNTTQTHRFVDMIAKISADKGVPFDFTDNKKIKGTRFAVEGRQVNGYITEDGTVTLNINSAKALNTIVGHEITHVLEGTDFYDKFQSVLFEYAKSKKDYQSRHDDLVKTYEGVEGTDIDAELTADLVGDYLFSDKNFIKRLSTEHRNIFQKIYDEIKYLARVATAGSKEARELERIKKMFEDVYRGSGKASAETTVESELNEIHLEYDAESETVSYSLSSLEEAFGLKKGAITESVELDGNYKAAEDYIKAREEYVNALAKSIALDKNNITDEEYAKANNYLDGLFLIGEMIAKDTDRLDYEAAVDKSSWVSNSEYGGSIDFSTLCAKRRLFTGTFDAIQNLLPDTVLDENDFLQIRNMLLEKDLESPCSMCYVEGSRAKHGEYVAKFLKEYLATNPEWKPQIADFTSSVRLEQTRINHPEAYEAYTKAMNKLAQRKPKEASVRTDYKGEILVAFEDGSSVEIKNQNGGIRFNSFSDFEIIHALDCMQVITDMARVGLNGQAYTKVAEFAEAFGNTGLKINLSLVAKDVDANGKLVFDEVNGMKYSEAMRLRNAYSENVGTVIVAFNEAQVRAALADNSIDYVLPFHRSQWKKSQYTMMGLPSVTKDFTMQQNDRIKNPKTGRPVKLSKLKQTTTYTNDITGESFKIQDNIMPNQYWDWNVSGRENAQRYLDYINSNGMTPKFDFLLEKADGKWALPEGAVGDGYYKLLIDFKMYNNDGWGAPQKPVLPEFNMGFIQKMLNDYTGGHQAFPVAHDVVDEFVKSKQGAKRSLSLDTEQSDSKSRGSVYGEDISYAPEKETVPVRVKEKTNAEVAPVKTTSNTITRGDKTVSEAMEVASDKSKLAKDVAPTKQRAHKGDVAKVLTKEPKTKKKKLGAWKWTKEHILDKGLVFEDWSLKTKNPKLQALWNAIRYADGKAQKLIGEGNDSVNSLVSIKEKVDKAGKAEAFFEYLYHMHNVDRMTLTERFGDVPNKAVFGDSVTANVSRKTAAKLLKSNPEFKQWADEVYEYNRYLRKLLVDNGIISNETAELWEQMYPHYVPIRREGYNGLNINVPLDTGRTGVNAPVRSATGGNSSILPLFGTMAQRTLQTYNAIARNRFGIELKNTLNQSVKPSVLNKVAEALDELLEHLDDGRGILTKAENGVPATFTVFEDGKRVEFDITDEMYEALKPTADVFRGTSKILNTASNLKRAVITEYNPWFLIKNSIKDVQDVFLNSQHAAKTYAAIPSAIKQMASKGQWYQEYMDNGGDRKKYFNSDTNTFEEERKIPFLNLISKANNTIETLPRLAEYIASRKAGRSIEVAMMDAARVTTNFAAGGDVTKWLNRNGATFLNASVQGAMQQVRNIREAKMNGLRGWATLAAKYIAAGLPAVALNNLIWDDDEEYEDLSEYVKDNYYIVGKFGDGEFVRIPKGRTVAVIQDAFEQISNAITGDDEVDLKNFVELVITNLAPNDPLNNNVLSPLIQTIRNKTWYGEDLVPTRLQDLPAAEQYDESTDDISRWLGEKTAGWHIGDFSLEISPYKANYLLDQSSGVLGDTFLPMRTPEAESGNDTFAGKAIAPLKDMFTTDSVMNNQNVSDFYDLSDELTKNANSRMATDEDVLKKKYIDSVKSQINELYKKKREIQNDDLPDSEKYNKARAVQSQINELAKNALSVYENISRDGRYAEIGGVYFEWYTPKKGDAYWRKLSDAQTTKYLQTSN